MPKCKLCPRYLFKLMWRVSSILVGLVSSLNLKSSMKLGISTKSLSPFSLDSAEVHKIPSSDDVISRYCELDPETTPHLKSASLIQAVEVDDNGSSTRENLLYGRCEEDSDCQSRGPARPYCIDNICRECREGYEFEDCGPNGSVCNADTGYTCSSCSSDEDCHGSSTCRSVFSMQSMFRDGKMPRKSCTSCPNIPSSAELTNPSSCEWSCPIETYYLTPSSDDEEPSCLHCPRCSAGQFYAPRRSYSTNFVSVCTNATDIICNDCSSIGINDKKADVCVNLLSPSMRHLDDLFVGDLGSHLPCRFFECKSGWFLNGSRSKCKKCHLTMCPPGEYLKGCGKADPGTCSACRGTLPKNAEFIDPTDPRFPVAKPEDACRFTCPLGHRYESGACVACSDACEDQTYDLEE
jgi:hypothetical protein